jgi:hypothetical protein
MPEIFISGSDMVVVVSGVFDPLGLLTAAEMLTPTSATYTLYSDTAYSAAVSGASGLAMTAFAGQTVAPFRYYAIIPATVTVTMGTTYYGAATIVATDASGPSPSTRVFRGPVTVRNPI